MKVAIQSLEPQYNNLAIDKIRMYHKSLGDEVVDYKPLDPKNNYQIPIEADSYDKIYCSSIFTFTDKMQADPRAICGGTGFDIKLKLPEEIESMRPKTNYGFCSRGCNNKCPWCVVPEKEGKATPYCDIYEIWDGKSKTVKLWDNNILQLPEHFIYISKQLHKEKLTVDFNQGLDIRLMDNDIACILKTKYLKHVEYHFAFDDSRLDKVIENKIKILKANSINRSTFYVLVGYPKHSNYTVKEDIEDSLYRLYLLKSLGQNAMVMRYRKIYDTQPESLITEKDKKLYMAIANWGSAHGAFHGMDFFEHYLSKHERGIRYKKYFQELGLYRNDVL